MPTNPSIGWQKLLYAYYNIRTCYDSLNWSVDHIYSNCKVAVSAHTTLLALADKLVAHYSVIEVYSISGNKIWLLFHNALATITDFCFHNENLVVVLLNFKLRYYTDFRRTFNEYSLVDDYVTLTNISESSLDTGYSYKQVITNLETNETEEALQIVETAVYGDFLVVRYRDKLTATSLLTFSNYEIPFEGMDPLKVNCMAFLAASARSLDMLVSYQSTVIHISLDTENRTYEITDMAITVGPFSMMVASANGSFVALFNDVDSKIYVSNKDFNRELLVYDTLNESSAPYMMDWAGEDAIILSLREEIKLIGPQQTSISFFYDIIDDQDFDLSWDHGDGGNNQKFTIPIIKSEKDGLKIITDNKVEFLARVPKCSIDLLLVGSSHPSSILLDCVDKLLHQSSKADTNIAYLKGEKSLEIAIRGCLDAALDEFSAVWQKKILKAVSFGKLYVDDYFNADEYLKTLNFIKVLNQLRVPEIGLFLTHSEVLDIGWPEVIRMLLRRSQHLIAIKIIDLLELKEVKSLVYVDWCCTKIMLEPDMPAQELFKVILRKLVSQSRNSRELQKNTVPITDIFQIAQQEGQMELCQLLVDLEPSAMQKLKLLLDIGQPELALIKCFETVDADLCRVLLLHLNDTTSLSRFLRILNQVERKTTPEIDASASSPEGKYILKFLREELFVSGDIIGNFWEQSIAKNDRKVLELYYKHDDRVNERNKLKLRKYLEEIPHEYGGDYDSIYQAQKGKLVSLSGNKKLSKLLNIELDLLETKRKLSETYQQSFFEENSVIAVVEKLITLKQLKVAADVCRNHRISSQKLWNIILERCCKEREFERLHTFIVKSNAKSAKIYKAPISFETIAETCIFYNGPKEHISTYISCCTDVSPSRRAELYLENDDLSNAADEAIKTTDVELLKHISQKAQDRDENVQNTIQQYLARL